MLGVLHDFLKANGAAPEEAPPPPAAEAEDKDKEAEADAELAEPDK